MGFALKHNKVESEQRPLNGSNADITNQCESKQALNVSAGTLLSTGTSFNPTEEGLRAPQRQEMSVENVSSCLEVAQDKSSHYDNSDPVPPRQHVVSYSRKDRFVTTSPSSWNIDNTVVHSLKPQSHDLPMDQKSSIRTSSWKSNHGSSNKTTSWPQDPEMCMFRSTVSIVEPKNNKRQMAILHDRSNARKTHHQVSRDYNLWN
ncbi:hypothetical protein Tco_0410923 [Tanacetum coccineum]